MSKPTTEQADGRAQGTADTQELRDMLQNCRDWLFHAYRNVSSVTADKVKAKQRKAVPIFSGVLRYFPDAIAAVADLSRIGNEQHNPGQPLHWAREKSTDQEDCAARHLIEVGTLDTDGVRHSAKLAWRALAILQLELEAERKPVTVDVQTDTSKRYVTTSQSQDFGSWTPAMWGKALETKFGFTVGETVNCVGATVGYYPGTVQGFTDSLVVVYWKGDMPGRELGNYGTWEPSELRHGQ